MFPLLLKSSNEECWRFWSAWVDAGRAAPKSGSNGIRVAGKRARADREWCFFSDIIVCTE